LKPKLEEKVPRSSQKGSSHGQVFDNVVTIEGQADKIVQS
jgi:hypothetical protein